MGRWALVVCAVAVFAVQLVGAQGASAEVIWVVEPRDRSLMC